MRHQTDFQPAEEGRGARAMVDAGVVDDVDYFTAVHIGTGVPADTVVCGSDNLWQPPNLTRTSPGPPLTQRKTRRRSQCLVGGSTSNSCTACNRPHSEGASRVNVGVMQAGSGRNVVPASALLKVETRGPATSLINMF